MDCKSLEKVTIPDSVTTIETCAFMGCSSLGPEFTVKSNITFVGFFSFNSCPKLKRFIIEDSNKSLRGTGYVLNEDNLDYMYVGRPFETTACADSIKVLELGPSLKTNDFPSGDNLKKIISNIENPALFNPYFSYFTYQNVPLYVPVGKVDAYRHAEGWKNFVYIYENNGEVNKIDNVAAAKKAGATMYYNLSGQAVAKDYKGVVIERYSDGTSKKVLNK